MKVAQFEFNLFGVNTYIVWDTATLEAAIVDPGMENPDECARLKQFIERERLQVTSLINTHLHIDHTMGNDYVKDVFDVGLTACADDEFLGKTRGEQAAAFHLRNAPVTPVTIDIEVKDGDKLYVGNGELTVISVPGHSPGSIALYCEKSGFVITGDALFAGSIGRTDLPGGNHSTLLNAIKTKLFTLPDSTAVLPGHGPETTIGAEKRSNPFF